MPSIPVPEIYQPGVIALVHLDDTQYSQLLSSLQSAKPALFSRELASQVAPKIDNLKLRDVREIVELLVAMYAVRARIGMTADEFATGVGNGLDEFEEADFSEEDRVRLVSRLTKLLEIKKSLGITSKASDVLSEHEHIFCGVRILTDIRPIFQDDLSSDPSEAVIIHILKIAYHQDREHKEFYVAMDASDIQKLKSAIERAELKDSSAKTMLDKADVLCLGGE